jgi:signal transduction histidine kinase
MNNQEINQILQQTSIEAVFLFDAELRCIGGLGDPTRLGVIGTENKAPITDILSDIPVDIKVIALDALAGTTTRQTFTLGDRVYTINAAPMTSLNGVGMISITDVTETKDIWKNQHLKDLEQERSQLVQNFIRDVSHEFRSPVTAIKIDLYLLSRETDGERQAQRISQIDQRADEIIELVDDLKAMATVDYAANTTVDLIDLSAITHTAYQIALGQTNQNSRLIRLNTQADDLRMIGNKDELLRALVEVISNAIRYTPRTGSIVITTSSKDGWHTVTVTDNGQGMDAATLASAFTRFQRGDVAHTTRGLGLGLPMTKRIVERSGGKITIDSTHHEGTTVTMTFPQSENVELAGYKLRNHLSSDLLG